MGIKVYYRKRQKTKYAKRHELRRMDQILYYIYNIHIQFTFISIDT
jgi:hypothetical protein